MRFEDEEKFKRYRVAMGALWGWGGSYEERMVVLEVIVYKSDMKWIDSSLMGYLMFN